MIISLNITPHTLFYIEEGNDKKLELNQKNLIMMMMMAFLVHGLIHNNKTVSMSKKAPAKISMGIF